MNCLVRDYKFEENCGWSSNIVDFDREGVLLDQETWIDQKEDIERQRKLCNQLKILPKFSEFHAYIHPEARIGTHFLRKMGDAFFD